MSLSVFSFLCFSVSEAFNLVYIHPIWTAATVHKLHRKIVKTIQSLRPSLHLVLKFASAVGSQSGQR